MRSQILGAVLGVALLCWAGQSHAEKKPGDDDKKADALKKADADAPHDKKAESKVDLFKGWIDLSVYTIVIFLILFTILRIFAWGPIASGLDKREQSIAHDRKEADKAKQEAANLRTTLETERSKANDEIRRMIDKARTDAQSLVAEELARGKAELATERERMKREVEVSYAQAKQDVLSQGAKLAALLSAKVIKKNLTEQDHRVLISEALNEFHAAASARRSDIESATA